MTSDGTIFLCRVYRRVLCLVRCYPASKTRELTECVEGGAHNTAQVLRLLVENEILRLNVWNNPVNDPKRGVDNIGTVEKSMGDVSSMVLTLSGSVANVSPIDDMGNVR